MNIKEIDTKKAINFCEKLKNSLMIGQMDIIITLLKRGEKFEKMWGEIIRYYKYMEWKDEIIEKIKQKYFPKPVKKTITIEIEGKNKEEVEDKLKVLTNDIGFLNREYKNNCVKYTIKEGD